jgi:hypothetical protein
MVRGKPGKPPGPAGLRKNWSGGPLRGLCGNRERGSGKEGLAGPGSATSRVSAHYRIGVRKAFFFFKSFYNLLTNFNSIALHNIKENMHRHEMQQLNIYLNI